MGQYPRRSDVLCNPHHRTLSAARAGVILTALLLAACSMTAQGRRDAQLRHELDAVRINQPLPEVWPAVLHLLADHGYDLVGNDRLVVGAPEAGIFSRYTGGGFATTKLRNNQGFELETMKDASRIRHRAQGGPDGASWCQVRFISIEETGTPPTEVKSRDLDLELELLRRVDPEQAKRIEQSVSAVK